MVKFALSKNMKYKILYLSLILLFTSCVSKKKYTALQKQHEESLNDKVVLESVLNKISIENDSIKKQLALVDSLFLAERIKNNTLNGAGTSEVSAKGKAGPAISKALEYDTKALYIYNIPNYVFWPSSVKADKFLIGIIGYSKLNAALGAYMYGKNIHRLPAIVEPYAPAPGKFYHMIFIAESKEKEFSKIHNELKGQPVLLIVENKYLERSGAHVSVYEEGGKIKFNVNKKQIEKTGLSVSQSLVKLGQNTQ